MMGNDIIKVSQLQYTSPLLAIPKKDSNIRLCFDAQKIKKLLISDCTLSGEIEEIMKQWQENQPPRQVIEMVEFPNDH